MTQAKLSKSKGGSIITLQSLIDLGYDPLAPLACKYLCLQAHYRSELNFSTHALEAGLRKIYALCPNSDPLASDETAFATARGRVLAAINDDLSIPQAVGILNSYGSHRLWLEFDPIMGLDVAKRSCEEAAPLPADVLTMVQARNAARAAKNWAESDALRNQLIELGYDVGDGPKGTTVKLRSL